MIKISKFKGRRVWEGTIQRIDFAPVHWRVFVYGSNTEGRNGKGAALFASDELGAEYGVAFGHSGPCTFAICTKNLSKTRHPSVTEEIIQWQIETLYTIAKKSPTVDYIISYTDKPNLNGYTPWHMASMFYGSWGHVPENIIFNKQLLKLYHETN